MTSKLITAIRALVLYKNDQIKIRLIQIVGEIRERETIVELLPVFHLIDPAFDVIAEMRSGLASHERLGYVACLRSLVYWIRNDGAALLPAGVQLPPVPLEVVRELGVIVANRRQPNLDQALSASSFYVSKSSELETSFVHSILVGLEFLHTELQYSFEESMTSIYEYHSIPVLRQNAVELAFSLRHYHDRRDTIVDKWLESAINDPLPEIRHELSKSLDLHSPEKFSIASNPPNLFSKLKPLLMKTAIAKDVDDVKNRLTRLEVDSVETPAPDPRLVALAICAAAKITLVSKKARFAEFVEDTMSSKATDPKHLRRIFDIARGDDSEHPKETLRLIEAAFLGVDSIKLLSSKKEHAKRLSASERSQPKQY